MSLKNQEILKIPKLAMIVLGIYRNNFTESIALRRIYLIYSLIVHVFVFIFMTSMTFWVAMVLAEKDRSEELTEKLISNLAYLASIYVALIKVIFYETKSLQQMITTVENKEKEIQQSQEQEQLETYAAQARFCTKYNLFALATHIFIYGFAMYGNIATRIKIGRWNKLYNKTMEKPLIYEVYYPKMDPIRHETFIMLFSNLGVTIMIWLSFSTCMLLGFIVFVPSTAKALQNALRNMSHLKADLSALKVAAVQHQQFVRFVTDMNDSVKYLLLMEYITVSFNVALTAFTVLKEKSFLLQLGILLYSGSIVAYVLILGWSCSEIKFQSMEIASAVYESPWYQHSKEAKSILFIIMVRAQRPLIVTKGPFGEMSLESSVAVLKAAYTYVTIMLQKYRK
ncbi:odorant receptor Or2-like isoform X2 [Cylas formicarius]|uniref:odorant receptor Or2-like isoform X2 n=1 Tax=Cylas formicarius TaxID=197179 RepID=UPI002958C43C|nr:odorant receptor Or2-like isoform X2 [Cylas formicarius]